MIYTLVINEVGTCLFFPHTQISKNVVASSWLRMYSDTNTIPMLEAGGVITSMLFMTNYIALKLGVFEVFPMFYFLGTKHNKLFEALLDGLNIV